MVLWYLPTFSRWMATLGVKTNNPWFVLFAAKAVSVLILFCFTRAALPRYRWDQLMTLAWRTFLPLVLSGCFFIFGELLFFANITSSLEASSFAPLTPCAFLLRHDIDYLTAPENILRDQIRLRSLRNLLPRATRAYLNNVTYNPLIQSDFPSNQRKYLYTQFGWVREPFPYRPTGLICAFFDFFDPTIFNRIMSKLMPYTEWAQSAHDWPLPPGTVPYNIKHFRIRIMHSFSKLIHVTRMYALPKGALGPITNELNYLNNIVINLKHDRLFYPVCQGPLWFNTTLQNIERYFYQMIDLPLHRAFSMNLTEDGPISYKLRFTPENRLINPKHYTPGFPFFIPISHYRKYKLDNGTTIYSLHFNPERTPLDPPIGGPVGFAYYKYYKLSNLYRNPSCK